MTVFSLIPKYYVRLYSWIRLMVNDKSIAPKCGSFKKKVDEKLRRQMRET